MMHAADRQPMFSDHTGFYDRDDQIYFFHESPIQCRNVLQTFTSVKARTAAFAALDLMLAIAAIGFVGFSLERGQACSLVQWWLCTTCRQQTASVDDCSLYFQALGFSCWFQDVVFILPFASSLVASLPFLYCGMRHTQPLAILPYLMVKTLSMICFIAVTVYVTVLSCWWVVVVTFGIFCTIMGYITFNAWMCFAAVRREWERFS